MQKKASGTFDEWLTGPLPFAIGVSGLCILLGAGCGRPVGEEPSRSGEVPAVSTGIPGEGTLPTMEARLAGLRENADPAGNYYLNGQRVALYRKLLEQADSREEELHAMLELAHELLNSGESRAAAEMFARFEGSIREADPRYFEANRAYLRFKQAVAWLRVAEQENCLAHHNVDSCLVPIKNHGVHSERTGAARALALFLEVLHEEPDNRMALWLLNLSAMTLGSRPDAVPGEFRLNPDVFRSEAALPRFYDVAPELGIAVNGHAGGLVMDDLDGDGWLDLAMSSWGLEDPMHVFLNDRRGGFEDISEKAVSRGLTGGLNLVHADYDNDGDVDILVLRGAWMEGQGRHPNSLLRNRGDGTFEDVTTEAGMLSLHPTQSATWFDYDGDGWLDLFVANESTSGERHPCELFHNRGNGTFENVAEDAGVAVEGFFKAVVSGDYDNDGDSDLFLSHLGGPNLLFRNDGLGPDGSWRFTDVTSAAGVAAPVMSFPAWFWDYDNDGRLDLFVADYDIPQMGDIVDRYRGRPMRGEGLRLYRNRGNGAFEDVSERVGLKLATLAMGVNFGDLDSDGWLDFYLGTGASDFSAAFPNRMFLNRAGRGFADVTTAGGFGHVQKGHGIAFGDYDHDGDQDVYAVMGGSYSGDVFFNALFSNPGNGNHWIGLVLEGRDSNRSGIGARIRVVVDAGDGPGEIHRVVGSGGSFGCNPLRQNIGLGQARRAEAIEIVWPGSGTRQTFRNLPAGRFYRIVEHAREPEELEWSDAAR